MRLLLDQHADVNATDAEGRSAILEAADKGQAIFRLLLEYGADVNVADVNVTDGDGSNLLMMAICNGDHSLARLLLEHGANVNSMDKNGGNTALMRAAYLCQVSTMSLLIHNQADVNARNHHGDTALMWACATKIRLYNQSNYDFEMARRKHDTVLLLLQ